ncbi:MAG: hypothetical protein ACRDBG_07245, partial [Waterburya sp.]
KVTITALASISNVSKSTVSRYAGAFGGVNVFTKLITKLLNAKPAKGNDDDMQFEAQTYLPMLSKEVSISEFVSALKDRIDAFGDEFLSYCRSEILTTLIHATLTA